MQEMQVQSLGQGDSLEKEMAIHSSILAWEKNPMNQEAWWTTPHGAAKSWTQQLNNHKNNSWIQSLQLCPW